MARIKIEDLPVLEELSELAIRGIFGGISNFQQPSPQAHYAQYLEGYFDMGCTSYTHPVPLRDAVNYIQAGAPHIVSVAVDDPTGGGLLRGE